MDFTILPALNEIASEQANPTEKNKQKAQQLMDYVATYPKAYIRYYASKIIPNIDSNAAYFIALKARSRVVKYYHLTGDHTQNPKLNEDIRVECKTLRHVVSSAAETEVGGVFHNAKIAIPIRNLRHALGHLQPPTSIKTDNSTEFCFIYHNIHQRHSKYWDM